LKDINRDSKEYHAVRIIDAVDGIPASNSQKPVVTEGGDGGTDNTNPIIGRWQGTRDQTLSFLKDGEYSVDPIGIKGHWQTNQNTLTLTFDGGRTSTMQIKSLTDKEIILESDGRSETYPRLQQSEDVNIDHSVGIDSDSQLSTKLIGEWKGTRHAYQFMKDGTWRYDPALGTTHGNWRISHGKLIETWRFIGSPNDSSSSYDIISLENGTLNLSGSDGRVFIWTRMERPL